MMVVILIFSGLYLVLWGKRKQKISEILSSLDEEDQTTNAEVNHFCEEAGVKTTLLPVNNMLQSSTLIYIQGHIIQCHTIYYKH